MQTLFAKLSFALLCVILLIGSGFFLVAQNGTRLYYEEITQRLNAPIAMYIAGRSQLIEDGVANREALSALASEAMVVNPSLEIYLLDTDGRIIAHALPPQAVIQNRVDLEPVRALVNGGIELPLRGSDPRTETSRKIFSAFPVSQGDQLQGYIYVILSGQAYDALAENIRGSYVQGLIAWMLAAILFAAFLTGLLVFGLLTRRLARLSSDVRTATSANFDPALLPGPRSHSLTARDEIGELRHAFQRMAERIHEQIGELREIDQSRRELVSNVAHDLRTPLASMHGYIETLMIRENRLSSAERRSYLEITHRHSERLRRLVDELFELSKFDAASITPALEDFPLAELLHDVVAEFALLAEEQGVTLEIDTGGKPAAVRADIGLMQRVFENLLQNALEHTPRGGSITVTLDTQPGQVMIAVTDTGHGIAAQDLERIFDRCYRADAGRRGSTNSNGLGLAIVAKILELHGSKINVDSEPRRGTRFEFALPIARIASNA